MANYYYMLNMMLYDVAAVAAVVAVVAVEAVEAM